MTSLYLTNGSIIDCAGDNMMPVAANVLIEEGKIVCLDPAQGAPPPDAVVIDLAGAYLLPFYAILRADGSTVATFAGLTRYLDEFVAFLEQGTP